MRHSTLIIDGSVPHFTRSDLPLLIYVAVFQVVHIRRTSVIIRAVAVATASLGVLEATGLHQWSQAFEGALYGFLVAFVVWYVEVLLDIRRRTRMGIPVLIEDTAGNRAAWDPSYTISYRLKLGEARKAGTEAANPGVPREDFD